MKTIKVISKLVARDLSVNELEAEKINSFYWKEVKSKLISLEVPTIYLKEIGTLTISKYKLYKQIQDLIRKLRYIPNLTYTEETKEAYRKTTTRTLQLCLIQRNIIATEEYEYIQRNKSTSTESYQECR